jgi:signal transduction histidine kinase
MARVTPAASSARIRRLVFAVLIAILVVPTAIVVTVDRLARVGRNEIAETTEAAAREAAAADGEPALREIAARHQVRLWLVTPGAGLAFDSDQQPAARSDIGYGSLFAGSASALIDRFEDGRAPPTQREHVLLARELGHSAGCATYAEDRILVCEAARRTPAGNIVLVQRAAPRIASRLGDAREGLLLLGGGVLLAGVVLAAWLVRRLTRPLDDLHRQVTARARGDQQAIAIPRAPREIAEVAAAVDHLAGELEARRLREAAAAADLAHELKSPLGRIKLALEAGGLDPAARATLDDHARNAVRAIDRTVADLLEIARTEAGLLDEPRAPVELHALASQVLVDRPPPPAITAEVTGTAQATVAAGALTRALGHLLDNAYAHATSRVTIEVADAQITVRDDGPGVPAELRPRLFQRFASRRAGGTGLGLAFVRAVAEAHGGDATLAEAPGAAFVIRLAPVHTPSTHV